MALVDLVSEDFVADCQSGRPQHLVKSLIPRREEDDPTITYAELAHRTARFANVLRSLGVGYGERVFTLLGRCPELFVT